MQIGANCDRRLDSARRESTKLFSRALPLSPRFALRFTRICSRSVRYRNSNKPTTRHRHVSLIAERGWNGSGLIYVRKSTV